ncbi:MAG TPA: 3-isopropylmalate dehydratase small subunit [Gemmatales bacterium]|nr:3-isopropylmalate dehydratase small subunit [Gemmatales bacterium]
MARFTTLSSAMIPLVRNDIDTDQIIPARFLKVTDKLGLGKNLFADWRYEADGSAKAHFILNQPSQQGRTILLAGDNFGCGSSREHAPWALAGWGIRAVVAQGFADIFKSNALKNGVLPVQPDDVTFHARLVALTSQAPDTVVTIDLEKQRISLPDGTGSSFPVDGFSKTCLLNDLDELGYLLRFEQQITGYEAKRAG